MTSIQCHRATIHEKGKESTFGGNAKGVRWKEWYAGKVLTNSLNVNDGGLGRSRALGCKASKIHIIVPTTLYNTDRYAAEVGSWPRLAKSPNFGSAHSP